MGEKIFLGSLAVCVLFIGLGAGVYFYRDARLARAPAQVPVVDNADYRQACGGCHMAYPPGLLPARSAVRLISGAEEHFGVRLELAPGRRDALLHHMVNHAADGASHRYARALMHSLHAVEPGPLRISEIPYIRQFHRSASVNGKLVDCRGCHPKAEDGLFRP
jgi:hypothetical protein